MIWIGLHGVMFLFLFSEFYDQAYRKKQAIHKKDDNANNGNGITHHTNGTNGINNGAINQKVIKIKIKLTKLQTSTTVLIID